MTNLANKTNSLGFNNNSGKNTELLSSFQGPILWNSFSPKKDKIIHSYTRILVLKSLNSC